ncbi:ADP-ribosylation factor family-domain-containing protein, partial [Phakopsora pachyrhizi]
WDLRGQMLIGPYWRCYYANTQAMIDVVDSNNRDQLPIIKAELLATPSEDELKDAKLFFFENTQDQLNTLTLAQ